jgi:hypothetical protein
MDVSATSLLSVAIDALDTVKVGVGSAKFFEVNSVRET